jgi:hypothetical protein
MRIQCGKILKNLLSKILRSVATLEVLANNQEQLPVINKMRIYCGKFMGSVPNCRSVASRQFQVKVRGEDEQWNSQF